MVSLPTHIYVNVLNTYLLYVSPLFGNLAFGSQRFLSRFGILENEFAFSYIYISIISVDIQQFRIVYRHFSKNFWLNQTLLLTYYLDPVFTHGIQILICNNANFFTLYCFLDTDVKASGVKWHLYQDLIFCVDQNQPVGTNSLQCWLVITQLRRNIFCTYFLWKCS